MRKNLFHFFLAFIIGANFFSCSSSSSSKDPVSSLQVEEKNYPLVMDFTATWCGPCGQNGTPLFKKIAAANQGEASFMAVHTTSSELVAHMGDLTFSPAVWAFFNRLGLNVSAIPTFAVNGIAVTTNENSINSSMNTFRSRIVEAGVNFTASKSAKGIDITYKTKFFSDVEGDYYVGFYLTEDGIMHRQAVGSAYQSTYEHSKILRAILNPDKIEELTINTQQGSATVYLSFGKELESGTISKGRENSGKVKFEYDASKFDSSGKGAAVNPFVWNAANKYNVVAVIWRKSGTNYVFVNSKTLSL